LQNNSSVTELQEFLTNQGVYSGPITGNFYSLTLVGVKAFQERENISPVAGYFGPLTRTRANELLSVDVSASNQQAIQETGNTPPTPEPEKTTNDIIKSLQDQIALLLQQVDLL
jgi:peptidoglycan hydrolase-like protein with peptidoglycan-binding domain